MMRLATALFFIPLLVLSFGVNTADAGRLWCSADPVVSLDQRLVSITIAIPLEYLLLVNGPTSVEIKTPSTVDRQVILDVGLNLHGSIVTFVDGKGVEQEGRFPVEIKVSVPVDKSQLEPDEVVPLKVTVLPILGPPVSAEGTADHTKVSTTIRGG
jgi:hypothetical protein